MKAPVLPGIDLFLGAAGRPWRKSRLGLILHAASVTSRLEPTLDALQRAGFHVTTLFAPEHGWTGALQDQAPVQAARDPRTGLPVFSLYGKHLSPPPARLSNLDALVFDLQDIGVRYYTFIWTMVLALKACANLNIPLLVLDRPNPLGGLKIEGNWPDPSYASFVGLYPLPVLHGLTVGELAGYFNATYGWGAGLHVVPMSGWRREMRYDDTGLPWVLPSPNMPTLDTATVYGGTCLLEATNLSEGRGTTRPFELVGAPFIQGDDLSRTLNQKRISGVHFRPVTFRPTFNKWAGTLCGGVQLHVTAPERFPSFTTGLILLQTVRRMYPRRFRWKSPPYEYETRRRPMDILCGTDRLRHAVDKGGDLGLEESSWSRDLRRFSRDRRHYQLYR